MQTKRKQTLLAGAGLLTALTLSVGTLAGCTPSKFTPGPGAPTQANTPGTPAAAVQTISGKADFLGAPFANADVKLTSLKTGNVIAVGGGNLKTDADGNYSVQVSGLAANDVIRVDIANSQGTLSALMSGDAAGAPAGYLVAATPPAQIIQTFISGFVDVRTSYLTDVTAPFFGTFVYGGLAFTGLNFSGFNGVGSMIGPYMADNANGSFMRNYLLNRNNPQNNNQNLKQITKATGVGSLLKETLTAAFKQVAKTDIKVAQAFNGQPLSPGLEDSVVTINGNTVTLNGETFDLGNTGTNNGGQENPTNNPLPTTEQQQETGTELDDPIGEWVNDGNMSPTVTIGTNSVTVAQDANEVQMVAMTMLLPKENLTGGSLANLSGGNLTGTVTGTTRSGAAREGDLTFSALNASNQGTISLSDGVTNYGQIGTYTVTDEGGTWKVKMTYTFNESGIEFVGAHETMVTASAVTLTKKDGMAIVIAGPGASSRVQY